MANKEKNISYAVKGMVTDFAPQNFQEGMYSFAYNAAVESMDGNGMPVLQNDFSNTLAVQFPVGSKVVGKVLVVEQNRIIWMLYYPSTGMSEIGETINPAATCREFTNDIEQACDDCPNVIEETPLEQIAQSPCSTYTTIQQDAGLNFSDKFPIKFIRYRLTACTLQIFFTDNNNPRRWLEFNYNNDDPSQGLVITPFFYQIIGFNNPPCDDPIYGPNLDINALNVQPSITTPCIDYLGESGGGSLIAGVYQFFIAMSDVNGNKLTSYLSATNPIPVRTQDSAAITNYPTDRSIHLAIQNVDPKGAFRYYILAVAKTIDSATTFYQVATLPVTTTSYTYTGSNQSEIKLTEADVITLYPYYDKAGAVGQSNGVLYWANMKESSKPNLQRVANNIHLQWQTIAIPESVYRNPDNVVRFRSAMRDEVYPMGMQFIFDSGEETNAYHIPGRVALQTDLATVSNNDVIPQNTCSGSTPSVRWQLYNTASIVGGDLNVYDGCTESVYQYGEFAYWESTERYPNNPPDFDIWGDLCGEPIRHHKFPDSTISHIHDNQNGSIELSGSTFLQNNLVFPIGVKVDHDSVRAAIADAVNTGVITAEDAARIVGYRLVRGNRVGNKSVICKGLLYDVNQYQRIDSSVPINIDDQPTYFANYPYNDLDSNPFITNDFNNYKKNGTPVGSDLPFTFSNRYTFHSPDTHFNQPGLGTELKLETVEYGVAKGSFVVSKQQSKQKLLSPFAYGVALVGAIGLVMAELIPQRTSSRTVVGEVNITGTVPLMQQTDGTSTVAIPSAEDLTETSVPAADVFQFDTGLGTRTYTDPGHTNTVTSVQGGFIQAFSPAAAVAFGEGSFANPIGIAMGAVGAAAGLISALTGPILFFASKVLTEMQIFLDLIESLVPFRDWTIQYDSVGKYNNYVVVPDDAGSKRRLISSWAYMDGNNQAISENGQSINFNNLNREDSVYLKYDGAAFPTAGVASGVVDKSRLRIGDDPFKCNLNTPQYTPISAYYGAIKESVPDQYGTVYDIEYLRTGSCAFDMTAQNSGATGVYGGDVFINRFALKIKVPYWLATTFNLPNGTDFDYSMVPNLAFPRYYFNTTTTVASGLASLSDTHLIDILTNFDNIYDLLGGPSSINECSETLSMDQKGYIHAYSYGIPYFLVESDFNTDFRYATNNAEGDFYPHQSNLDFWLQEMNVPISEPNTYNYNTSYSKQNKETFIGIDPPTFQPSRDCQVEHPGRIIYSDGNQWLVYKADNFFDYPVNKGKIISVDGIENDTVLVRTTNDVSIFKSILRLPVDGQTTQVGNGGIFSNPPQSFGETTLGYIGSQNRAMLQTEFGHLIADTKRGQIFNIATNASGLEPISSYGMRNWFKENMPFRILRSFPNMPEDDIDNEYLGIGLIMSFDKRFERFFITKLDYSSIDKNVNYDNVVKEFYIPDGTGRTEVMIGDPSYFKNCSWTISYNFNTKSWASYHSFKPNYYVDFIDFFSSGVNDQNNSTFWTHSLYNGSYQVYYGVLQPFIVEPISKFQQPLRDLRSIEFETEVRRYKNEFDYAIKKFLPGFNKAIIYNDLYNSGYLNLVKVDKNDFSLTGVYPIKNINSWDIEVAIANYKWRFNEFFALNDQESDIPLWIYSGNNSDKILNQSQFDYDMNDYDLSSIKGQWFKQRLINDSDSNHKILFKFGNTNETIQYR